MSLNDPPDQWRDPPPYQQPVNPAPGYAPSGYPAAGYLAPSYPAAGYRQPSAPPGYPPPGYQQPSAPPPRQPGSRRPLLAGLAGFLVAAIIAVVLCVTGVMPVRGSGSQVDSDPVALPATVGDYVRYQDAHAAADPDAKRSVTARERSDRATEAALRKSRDGAGAAVQSYASQDLEIMFTVWAVRASSPDLVTTVVDPHYLGLAVAPQAVKHFGAVSCVIVHTSYAREGEDPGAGRASLCQRTGDGLTVLIQNAASDLAEHPRQVVALVNRVWDALN